MNFWIPWTLLIILLSPLILIGLIIAVPVIIFGLKISVLSAIVLSIWLLPKLLLSLSGTVVEVKGNQKDITLKLV